MLWNLSGTSETNRLMLSIKKYTIFIQHKLKVVRQNKLIMAQLNKLKIVRLNKLTEKREL